MVDAIETAERHQQDTEKPERRISGPKQTQGNKPSSVHVGALRTSDIGFDEHGDSPGLYLQLFLLTQKLMGKKTPLHGSFATFGTNAAILDPSFINVMTVTFGSVNI